MDRRNNKQGIFVTVIVFLCAALTMSACGNADQSELQPAGKQIIKDTTVKQPEKLDKQTIAAALVAPEKQKDKPVIYSSGGRRDPFISLLTLYEERKEKKEKVQRRITHPLQQFRLETLKLVGIFRFNGKALGMIETSDGKAYSVKKGTPIGTNQGRVVSLGVDKVTVEEIFEDLLGRKKRVKQELTLEQAI